ncbi:MAG: Uma2 family endonuclease [Chloroflexaceae bacterium]|nr:Uma2 family endonuclease [Chloroflexaceae bacterium]
MTLTDTLPTVTPASHVPGPPQGRWTYADYARLPDDGQRYEVIDGVLYMTPAPGTEHQSVTNLIATFLTMHVQFAGLGKVFSAPTDVELAPGFVVQPDVLVISADRLHLITPSRISGPPDLVVEVTSPGTAGYDRREKQDAYARAGAPEYWIVDPHAQTVEVLVLEEGSYRSQGVFRGQARLPSRVIADFPTPVEQLFGSGHPAS